MSIVERKLAILAGLALLLVSACAHHDEASNAAQSGASAVAPTLASASPQVDSSGSLTDQIAGEMHRMDSNQNAAQADQDTYDRALQDPALAFSDATSAALARAAADGDAAQVRQLVAQGAHLDVHGINNITLLQWEILHGSIAGVSTLLDAGADPTQRGVDGKTAVSCAAQYASPDYLRALFDHHANPNATDEDGNTPLIDSMKRDDDPPIELLVQAGADVNHTGALGYTPLITAAMGLDSYARVLQLLQAGADPRATVTFGTRPPSTFQTYLNLAPRNTMSAEAKQQLDAVDDWLTAHNVPIEPPAQ